MENNTSFPFPASICHARVFYGLLFESVQGSSVSFPFPVGPISMHEQLFQMTTNKSSLRVVEWVALIMFLFGMCHY